MKYLILLALLALSGCRPNTESTVYVCFNPLNPIVPAEVRTPAPYVVESRNWLTVTADDGNRITVPKSLCFQIRKAQ